MVFLGNVSDPLEDDEFIYINKDEKNEDDEMQMLTPILLDSMFGLTTPPDIFRIVKDVDKDDGTEVTTDSFSDLLIPNFDTPPAITTVGSGSDASEISMTSACRREHHSPRTVISPSVAISHPFCIPADVRYDGKVMFAVSSAARHIHLQPRQSAQAENIFVPKSFGENASYGEYALADSISSYDNGHGAEECKDEEEDEPSYDEGFAYVYGDRYKEDEYWGVYDGHYGSRDFEEDARQHVDYATDHASVQGASGGASTKSARYQEFGGHPKEQSVLEDMQELLSSFFGCGGTYSAPFTSRVSNPVNRCRSKGAFGPADYGVASMS